MEPEIQLLAHYVVTTAARYGRDSDEAETAYLRLVQACSIVHGHEGEDADIDRAGEYIELVSRTIN